MRLVAREAFIKAFLLFFISMGILAGLLYWMQYLKAQENLNQELLSAMRVCSFNLTCNDFSIDFVPKKDETLNTLQHDINGLYAEFSISQSDEYALQLRYEADAYTLRLTQLHYEHLKSFALILMVIALLSALFSFYALHPLRSALILMREFVRDILHDVNTPLSVLRLNASLLQKEFPQHSKVVRIDQAITTILALQSNLHNYLDSHPMQYESVPLHTLLHERIALIEKLYPKLHFSLDARELNLTCNRDALTRIIDNLLDNASKYNRPDGSVRISIDPSAPILRIKDDGSGIKEPHKIFKRFYTETSRGSGIGLHIVKKLCDAMHITISAHSKIKQGSEFILNLKALT